METKQIKDLINSIIGTKEFKKLQENVAKEIFGKLNDFPFESEDDVRLVLIRIKDAFVSGLNFETSRHMVGLMGKKENEQCSSMKIQE